MSKHIPKDIFNTNEHGFFCKVIPDTAYTLKGTKALKVTRRESPFSYVLRGMVQKNFHSLQ
jgi:hypothetical protein